MTLMSVFTLTDFAIFFAGFVGVVAVFAALFALGELIGRNIKSRTALCIYAVFSALIVYGGSVIYAASNNPFTTPQPLAWLCALVPLLVGMGMVFTQVRESVRRWGKHLNDLT